MAVRAKFRCMSITQHADTSGVDIRLLPVQGKSGEENKIFWKYTPSGEITLRICNPVASEQFKPGAYYYVDFEEAPE